MAYDNGPRNMRQNDERDTRPPTTMNHDPDAPEHGWGCGIDFEELGTGEQLAALYTALAEARAKFAIPVKSETGRTGNQTYKYAAMVSLVEASVPALSAHGLVVIQPLALSGGALGRIRTILAHKDGARVVAMTEFRPVEDMKMLGAQTTYLSRYAYQRLLTLDGEADTDGVDDTRGPSVSGNRPVTRSAPQAPARAESAPQKPAAAAQPAQARQAPQAPQSAPQKPAAAAQPAAPAAAPPAKPEPEREPEPMPEPEPESFGGDEYGDDKTPESEVVRDMTPAQNNRLKELLIALGYRSTAIADLVKRHVGVTPNELINDSGKAAKLIGILESELQAKNG